MKGRRTAVIIYNPRSGAHRRRDRVAEVAGYQALLGERGIEAEPWPTTGPGTASALAGSAVEGGVDLVIANGGDGTLNEVLQGMVGQSTPLAIWPGGTANVLARDLGLPSDPAAMADLIAGGRERRISVGLAGHRYFFLMAGIGLDASIIQGVSPALKERAGEKAYWVSGLRHMVAWRPEPFTIEANGETYEGAFAAVGNAPSYGGGFRITPKARLDEAALDVCIFPTRRFAFTYTRDMVACLFGDPTRFGDVIYFKARSLSARGSQEAPPWVQVDGELLGPLPMSFEAVPEALTVVVPDATGGPDS
jgi:YegS/Rv2252/BmrU family lipid kinase